MEILEKELIKNNIKYLEKLNNENHKILAREVHVAESTFYKYLDSCDCRNGFFESVAEHYAISLEQLLYTNLEKENVSPINKSLDKAQWENNELLEPLFIILPDKITQNYWMLEEAQNLCKKLRYNNRLKYNIDTAEEALSLFYFFLDDYFVVEGIEKEEDLVDDEEDEWETEDIDFDSPFERYSFEEIIEIQKVAPFVAANVIWLIIHIYYDTIVYNAQNRPDYQDISQGELTVRKVNYSINFFKKNKEQLIDDEEVFRLESIYMESLELLINNEKLRELGYFYMAYKYIMGLKHDKCLLDSSTLTMVGNDMMYDLLRVDNRYARDYFWSYRTLMDQQPQIFGDLINIFDT